jgi:hypothetical protein
MAQNGNAVALRAQEAQITELPRRDAGQLIEAVVIKGDLSKLEPQERAGYYLAVCQSVGLNPLTRPFLYVQFADGGLQLYPRKEAADQLRGIHKIQTRIVEQRIEHGIFLVVVEARHPDGRVETDVGAVPIEGLKGLFLANAMKKGITQGKRRATLAMLGLSLIDDDEIKAVKGARFIEADPETGDVGTVAAPAVAEVPAEPVSPAPAATGNAERVAAVKAINAAVRKAFGQVEDAKAIRDDLVCDRYGLQDFKAATPAQLREAAEAVAGWSADWAPKAREWLRLVAGAANETMATDVALVLEEHGVDDAFIAAALSDALARFEDERQESLARIGAAVERAVATGA